MLPELSLEGRSAVVTGAGRGIGRAIALGLAEAGADVVVAARTEPQIEAVASDIRDLGRRAVAVRTDVTRSAEVDALVERALGEFGKVDIMVNNAGQIRMGPVVPFPDVTLKPPAVTRESTSRTTDEEWLGLLDSNLNGVFYGCRAVGPHMIERGYGKIINISSIAGKQAFPIYAAYCVSKTGIDMLTRILALEWADYNVCVNALAPGWYHTDLNPIWGRPRPDGPDPEGRPLRQGRRPRGAGDAGRVPRQPRFRLHDRADRLHRRRLHRQVGAALLLSLPSQGPFHPRVAL